MKKVLLVVLSLVFLASGLFIVSCKQQETAQEATEAPGYGEKAEEAAQGYGEKAKEAAQGYGEKAKEAAQGYGEKAKE